MTSRELKRSRYELEFEDGFESGELDTRRWLPYYLPHWSSRERSAARYAIEDGCLQLLIEEDQQPWCPELDGEVRVSSLQTGLFCGDPNLVEDFARVSVPIDAREFHVYSAEWTAERVSFFVDDEHVKTVDQSPSYPLQLMLGIYEFPADGKRAGAYPKRFTVAYVRGFRARE